MSMNIFEKFPTYLTCLEVYIRLLVFVIIFGFTNLKGLWEHMTRSLQSDHICVCNSKRPHVLTQICQKYHVLEPYH